MLSLSRGSVKWFVRLAVVAAFVPIITATSCPTTTSTGSCCVNGVCSITVSTGCSGIFTANGTCSPNPCPPPVPTTLLSETVTGSNAVGVLITNSPCIDPAVAHNRLIQSFNTVANKLVTCSVTGPLSTSRPRIQITDLFDTVVADSGPTPSSQTTTTTFTPSGAQLFKMRVEDCAASGIGDYTLLVTQAP